MLIDILICLGIMLFLAVVYICLRSRSVPRPPGEPRYSKKIGEILKDPDGRKQLSRMMCNRDFRGKIKLSTGKTVKFSRSMDK